MEQSRNYCCPSCLDVYDPEDAYDYVDSFDLIDIHDNLLDICDLGPLGAYGEGSIGDVTTTHFVSCPMCSEQILLNVVVTATPVYDDLDGESDKMPSVNYFHDIEIKYILPRDTPDNKTASLMGVFVFPDYDDDDDHYLPSVGEYDLTEDRLNLVITVKTRMNNGYCFIGWDMTKGELVRPILRTATNQCCWRKTDPVLDVGQQYRFQVYSHHLEEIPFPHKNNDVLVDYLESIAAEEINIFYLLFAKSCKRVEDVFNGADIKDGKYIIEGEKCPSVGIYGCSGKNLTWFQIKSRGGSVKNRCKVVEGNVAFVFPFTALQPYSPTNDEDVLVILGLARPFTGYNGEEYNPARCAILVLGIIPRPH